MRRIVAALLGVAVVVGVCAPAAAAPKAPRPLHCRLYRHPVRLPGVKGRYLVLYCPER